MNISYTTIGALLKEYGSYNYLVYYGNFTMMTECFHF